ncbi:MAG: isoprenylcysteine carboxylmethyltransferase family protein [Clostridia bacterium]|nr:isoprenylcysteine carboxylmethyltransferase family protein [Clostridia bacterium]
MAKRGDEMKLFINALSKFTLGILLVAFLLFLPAGTLDYPNAWLFIVVLFVPMFIFGIILFFISPKLLEKRLNLKEREGTQKGVVAFSALMFIGGFIFCALDFRFLLSAVPHWLTIASAVVFIIGYIMFAEVIRENQFLSRTVEVTEGQTVVDTGLYSLVRHPMYLATLLVFLPMPLILGSFYALLVFAAYPIIIVVRILNEEKVLTKELQGYAEYKQKVKYRLIPFVW